MLNEEAKSADYLARLKTWALYVAAVVAVSLLSALVQRYVGVKVDAPAPPPIQIVVTPGAEPGGATVTVVSPKP